MTALIENSAKRSTLSRPCSSICLEHTALSTSEQRSCWSCAALCTSDSAGTLFMSISSSRAALLSRSTASSNCKAVTLAASDRELDVPGKGARRTGGVGGKGREPAVSGGREESRPCWGGREESRPCRGKGGEPAVLGGKGGEPAVSGGREEVGAAVLCQQELTLFFPTFFTLTFGKTSVTGRDMAITLMLEPGNLVATIECSVAPRVHVYTYMYM